MCTNANKHMTAFKCMESLSAKAEERTSAQQGKFPSCASTARSWSRTFIGPELVDKVEVLRMNQGFIEFMRSDGAEDPQPSDEAPLRNCDVE